MVIKHHAEGKDVGAPWRVEHDDKPAKTARMNDLVGSSPCVKIDTKL